MHHDNHRGGFTVIELLTVLAVMAILAALVTPALHSAVESARITQCQSNVRQIGLAMHQHDVTEGRLPPASQTKPLAPTINSKGQPVASNKMKASAFLMLLPYLDQLALYRQYNFALGADDPANAEVGNRVLPIFVCPSMQMPDDGPTTGWASYGFSTGSGNCRFPKRLSDGKPDPTNHNGAIIDPVRGPTSLKLISRQDGLSRTLLVGDLDYGLTNLKEKSNNTVGPGGETRWASSYPGRNWCSAAGAFNSDQLITGFLELETFRSDHPGGVNFVMVDGAVLWLSDTISPDVLKQLADRTDGQPKYSP